MDDLRQLAERLTAENNRLKRKLEVYEGMGTDRVEAPDSTSQKKIKGPLPDLSEAFSQQIALSVPIDNRGTETHSQNVSKIFGLLENSDSSSDEWRTILERLVNGLPLEIRPELPDLNHRVWSTVLKEIWKEDTIKQFESMIHNSVSAFHILSHQLDSIHYKEVQI